jgi:hypothetical protein
LNHLVGTNWVASAENVDITASGGTASNGQHTVNFSANIINPAGSIELVMSNGMHLQSQVFGLVYYDPSNLTNVLFAVPTNRIGVVNSNLANQVIYTNAFDGCAADVRYTYTRQGLEQDIVVNQQLPDPLALGLNPQTTRLQVWTEFVNAPTPQITQIEENSDQYLDWGPMQMGSGRAFIIGGESDSVPVRKQWVTSTNSGRTFLIEEVQFSAIAEQLQTLPPFSGGTTNRSAQIKDFPNQLPPRPKMAQQNMGGLKLASTPFREKGLVLDYAAVTSSTNFTFQGDTTYYVSSAVTLSSNTTIEGGAVIKYADTNIASITLNGPLYCLTVPYRPAAFTSVYDNTVGENIYTGTNAPSNTNGLTYLVGGSLQTNDYKYLRFSYAGSAITNSGAATVWDSQFVKCVTPVGNTLGVTIWMHNVLIAQCTYCVSTTGTVYGEHLTADQCKQFCPHPYPAAYLTNSILTGVTNQANVNLYYSLSASNGSGIYQTAGAGNYYLANASPYRDAGTTNINTSLLLELSSKTTSPPLWWTNNVTVDTSLSPQASRDSNTPDLGYHYDPVDYLARCVVTNATLTLTNGVVLANYDTYAIMLQNGSALTSQGAPKQRNIITYFGLVQEQPVLLGSTSFGASGTIPINAYHTNLSQNPSISLRFTSMYSAENTSYVMLTGSGTRNINSFTMRDCEIYGAGDYWVMSDQAGAVVDLENNLFQYVQVTVGSSAQVTTYNNAYIANSNYATEIYNTGSAPFTNRDGVFDGCSVYLEGSCGHNAYVNVDPSLIFSTIDTTDIVTNFTWVVGPLGNYYQATNSVLVDAGSRTADLAELYHYTTQTNQTKETNSIVDIGYHYIALDTNGLPVDSNADGIPDYLEDANGDGWVDNGEKTWISAAQLFGPKLWLNADLATVTTNGSSNVSVWLDQSGNTNNAGQTTSGEQPLWVPNQASGWPVIRFSNPANTSMRLTNFQGSAVTQAEAFVLLKAKTNAPSAGTPLWDMGSNPEGILAYPNSSGMIVDFFGSTSAYILGIPAQRPDQYHIYNPVSASNYWAARINGRIQYVENFSDSTFPNNTVQFKSTPIIGSQNPSGAFDGDIAEILLYDHVLTEAQRDAVGDYLNHKYSVVSAVPAVPTNLTASAVSTTQIAVSWSSPLGTAKTGFYLERKTGSGGTFSQIASVNNGLSYFDTGLLAGTQYYYRVTAYNYEGQSGYSATNSATTLTAGVDIPLSDLRLWLKADSGVTIDASNRINIWLDQSSFSNVVFQADTNQQPTLQTNQVNGGPAVYYSGTTKLQLPNFLGTLTAGEGFVLVKAATMSPGGNRGLWHFAADNNNLLGYPTVSNTLVGDFGSTGVVGIVAPKGEGVPVQTITNFHLYDASSQYGNWNSWLNGVPQFSTTLNVVGFSQVSGMELGTSGGASDNHFVGNMAEVMVFDRALTVTERNAVGGYMNSRYNIVSSLPSSPSNLVASALSPTSMNLSWAPGSSNTASFAVERAVNSNGTYSVLGAVAAGFTNYVDTIADSTTPYFYRVKALNYDGASGYCTPVALPTVLITNLYNGIICTAGSNLTIVATASDPDGSVAKVDFYNFTTWLGTTNSGPYTLTVTNLSLFAESISALATDNNGNTRFSTPVSISVYPNTGGDGRNDALDIFFGLDPTTNSTPFNPSDHTPPVINLLLPSGATLLP